MNKPILKMLVGLSASGKSTYATEKMIKEGFVIHSSDSIRMELFNQLDNELMELKDRNDRNEKVFDTLNKRVIKDLKDGRNVIYDATNLSTKRRIAFLTNLNKIECEKECLIFNVPFEECVKNDLNRLKQIQVGRNVIKKQRESFNVPYYNEGWDRIELIRNNYRMEYTLSYQDLQAKMIGFNQVSKYHNLTLLEHCFLCRYNINTSDIRDIIGLSQEVSPTDLLDSAGLHDYGKLFTQSYDEEKQTSHYYNHENVGAFEIISSLYDCNANLLNIAFFINYHMMFKNELSKKAYDRRIKMFGKRNVKLLQILNEADDNAKLQTKDKSLGEFKKEETFGLSLGINQYVIGDTIAGNTLIVK